MEKIIFTSEEIEKCTEFSEKVDTSLYAKRNQWDANKRSIDAKIGKLGEIAIYRTLINKYSDLTYPDFAIYSAKEKSWDYDLKHSDFNIHVKSQEKLQSIKFKESWVFQNSDKHIFKNFNDNDYVSFVQVDLLQGSAIVKKILSVSLLHNKKLFKPMVLAHLTSKSAVYFEDIKDLDCELI